jgi:threonine dehydratase
MVTIDEIKAARERTAPHLHRTPLWRSATLSEMTGHQIHLKAELFQKTGSFKPRGMINALSRLDDTRREAGVITFSAGNAAQGLAYAAGILGVSATVVMPANASAAKAHATRDYGGEVILHGDAAACFELCRQLEAERGLTYVSSFDDLDLMTGHASLGLEIAEDLPEADVVFVGIGGGGLIGGVALGLRGLDSQARIIGVEPTGAPAMYRSFEAGHAVTLDKVETIADGLAPPFAGEHCYAIAREHVERVILVDDDQIAEAMKLILGRCKMLAEPAGAASLAGLLSAQVEVPAGAKVVCVLSGGNIDLDRLKALL